MRQVKKGIIFIGILLGIGFSLIGYNSLYGEKHVVVHQDYKLENGGIFKKGTRNTPIICDTIFEFGEKMPKFKGGNSELLKYHLDKIIPKLGASYKRTGNLITRFHYSLTISKEGKILETEILTKVDGQLEKDFNNEINNMPNWIPGKVNGKNVCMKIKIPISCIKWAE